MSFAFFETNLVHITAIVSCYLVQLDGNIYLNCEKQPPEAFYGKGVLRNFAKFTGKHLSQSLFFNKVAGQGLEVLILRNSPH